MLSYGLLPLGLLMVVVLVGGRRAWRSAVRRRCWHRGVAGARPPDRLLLVGGFAATHHAYVTTVASVRPYLYFLVADLVVLSVMVGPAVLAGRDGCSTAGCGPSSASAR